MDWFTTQQILFFEVSAIILVFAGIWELYERKKRKVRFE